MNIINFQWRSAKENTTLLQWGPGDGKLEILVDEYPEFVYEQLGNYFYAENNGFVSIFLLRPFTKDGFAGREIQLSMKDGTERFFEGSLWDPVVDIDDARIPPFCSVSLTTELEVMERGYTFYSYKILATKYKELRALCDEIKKREGENVHS